MTQQELEGLIRRAGGGDRGAFGQLAAAVQDRALALAYGRLGNTELARDAAQDALLDAYLHLAQLREPAAFWGWFRRVLQKHCDRYTRRKRPAASDVREHGAQLARPAPGADDALALSQQRAWLRGAIDALPAAQREVVALHYLAELPLAEVAELLAITDNAAKQRLHAARGRLSERRERAMEEANRADDVSDAARRTMAELRDGPAAARARGLAEAVRLFLAIRAGDVAEVRALLAAQPSLADAREHWDMGAPENASLPYPTAASPLIRAAELGHVEIIELLLQHGVATGGAHGIDVDGACGCATRESPLWAATVAGQLESARHLLAAGADPDRAGASGIAPLHVAAMRGRRELAALLLDHGARRDVRDPAGRTPADWARLKGHGALATLLATQAPPDADTRRSRDEAARRPGARAEPPLLATGIKALELFAPLSKGGLVRVEGGAGVGRNVLMAELSHLASGWPGTAVVWVDWEREVWSGSELEGLLAETDLASRVHVVSHAHDGGPDAAHVLGSRALAFADGLLAAGAVEHVLMVFFEQRGVRADVDALLAELVARPAVTALVVSPWEVADPAGACLAPPYDALIALSPSLARAICFPAIDPARSASRALSGPAAKRAAAARALLAEEASPRAQRLRAYLTQPFFVAEPNTGRPGASVDRAQLASDVDAILAGEADTLELESLYYGGALGDAERKAQ